MRGYLLQRHWPLMEVLITLRNLLGLENSNDSLFKKSIQFYGENAFLYVPKEMPDPKDAVI